VRGAPRGRSRAKPPRTHQRLTLRTSIPCGLPGCLCTQGFACECGACPLKLRAFERPHAKEAGRGGVPAPSPARGGPGRGPWRPWSPPLKATIQHHTNTKSGRAMSSNGKTRAFVHAALWKSLRLSHWAWNTRRVSPMAESPYDKDGVISLKLPMGSFLTSVAIAKGVVVARKHAASWPRPHPLALGQAAGVV